MKRAKPQVNKQDHEEEFFFDATLARGGVRYNYNQYEAATRGRQQRRIREEEKRGQANDKNN